MKRRRFSLLTLLAYDRDHWHLKHVIIVKFVILFRMADLFDDFMAMAMTLLLLFFLLFHPKTTTPYLCFDRLLLVILLELICL